MTAPTSQPSDLDTLQGTWRVTTVETEGAVVSPMGFENATITIRGETFVSRGMGDDYAGTIEVFRGTKPRAFDLHFTQGPPAGRKNLGIYKLDGDRWTICLATRGDDRPKRFATRADSGHALETLQREGTASAASAAIAAPSSTDTTKAAKTPKSRNRARPQAVDAAAREPSEIDGEWAMVSAVLNGVSLAPDMVKWCTRITRDGVTRIAAGPQTMLDARFTLDRSHTPAHIEYVNRSGANKGTAQSGIYELAGRSLRICMGAPGDARPAEFASAKGDARSFTTWSRLAN